MIKLFITLYIMVLASFGLFIGSGVLLDLMSDTLIRNSNIEREISQGTFNLLDESVKGLDSTQTNALINDYQTAFGKYFALLDQSEIALDKKQTQQLEQGEIVIIDVVNEEEDLDIILLYRKLPGSEKAWKIDLDLGTELSVDDDGVNMIITGDKFITGMLYVIQQRLAVETPNTWPETIKQIQTHYGQPLKLSSVSEIETTLVDMPEQLESFNTGKATNSTQGSDVATFVKKIPTENLAIQVGPIEIPWFILHLPMLILLAFVLSIATALFLWLLPLWFNLQKIKKAAIDFGNGNYDSRIKFSKRSSIAKVSAAFNSMAERTQNSIRSQKELTSAVSHELRTPVTRMRFALEMLENTKDPEEKKRYGKNINKDIDELNQLLEELLSYARFDQGNPKLNLRMKKLVPWISESIEKLIPLAKEKKLNHQVIGIGINESALFEARLLSRVLDNLVQNAIRYARNNIEVTLCKDSKNYLLIVEDDGCGIDEKDRHKVFEAFSRIDASRDKATGGFGLGLAISNKIIKAHQGHISIQKSDLGGAKFEVSWPVKIE